MKKNVWISAFCIVALGAAGVSAWHMFRGAPDTLRPLTGGGAQVAQAAGASGPGASAAGAVPQGGAGGSQTASGPQASQVAGAGAGGPPAPAAGGPGKPGGPGGPPGGAMPVPVEVMVVQPRAVNDEALSVGTLKSNESVVIRTEVAGKVQSVGFTDGQGVARGAVLLRIDDSVARAEVSQARAELGLALENLRRVQDLKEKNFVSASALDQAAAARDVAAAKLQLAEARLQRYTLSAPFAGTVGLRNIAPGDYIKEGADVVALEDLSSMRLDFRLPEKLSPAVRAGITLKATFESFPGREFTARVVAVDPQIDPAGRSILVRARLENPGLVLKPGMLARVVLDFGQRGGVILVPEEAVVPQGGDAFVYRVIEGKAVRTAVRLGSRRPGQVEITSGLQAGDQVVVAGQIRISRDQAPVRIVGPAS